MNNEQSKFDAEFERMTNVGEYLDIKAAAAYLGVSESRFRHRIQREVTQLVVGFGPTQRRYIHRDDLAKWKRDGSGAG
ncbi:MAG: hypothetical protein QM733_15710 [Ilumatobacteraceae bacterium]